MRGFLADRFSYILHSAETAKSVLHIGCTNSPATETRWKNGTLLHKTLADAAEAKGQSLVGIDIDREAVSWLSTRMPSVRLIHGDAHELSAHLPGERFDLIIAGDVIEHLPDPGRFLRSCRTSLTDDGRIVVTTINAFGLVRFLKGMLNHEAVHSEHTAYFSFSTMKRLAEMSDLRLTALGYIRFEPHLMKAGVNGFASVAIERAACAAWPQFAEGLVAELHAASHVM